MSFIVYIETLEKERFGVLLGHQERCSLSEFSSSSTPGRNEPLRRNENHRDEKALTAARCGKGRLHYVFAAICKWHP